MLRFEDSHSAEGMASRPQSFPLKVLMKRMGSCSSKWAPYLPDHLRPKGVPAKRFDAGNEQRLKKAGSGSSNEDKLQAYEAEGLPVGGRVWEFAQTANGSREVQHAIEHRTSNEELRAIRVELEDHVWDAMRCPHANHVMQKLVVESQPEDLQFIIDALVDGNLCVQAARHKFACRVIQRLVQYCSQGQVSKMVSTIVESASCVSCHAFGNYVIQALLQNPSVTKEQIVQICKDIRKQLANVCSDQHGVAVLSSLMTVGPDEEKTLLATALLEEPRLLVHLACSRHGHAAAREVLLVLQGEDQRLAHEILMAEEAVLLKSKYGRQLVSIATLPAGEGAKEPGPILLGRKTSEQAQGKI